MATVKGDVHDIGKNIAGVVLQCNGYEVEDLGVMVPLEEILEPGRRMEGRHNRAFGTHHSESGRNGEGGAELESRGWTTPLLIGGATTSPAHTALKIAPEIFGAGGPCQRRVNGPFSRIVPYGPG